MGSVLVLEVDIMLVSYSSAIFTYLGLDLIIFAASHVGSHLTSHISLFVHLCQSFPLPLKEIVAVWAVPFF
jgi:hypothetical protein